LYSIVDQLTLV